MRLSISDWANLGEAERNALLQRPSSSQAGTVDDEAARIVTSVRTGGDDALRELTQQLDAASVADFRVSAAELSAAKNTLTSEQLAAIELAIKAQAQATQVE